MPNLAPKTIMGRVACAGCGKPVDLKVNKNGMAYYFCNNSDPKFDYAPCSHHQKWGRMASSQMQSEYLARRNPANENRAPKGAAANKSEAPKNERTNPDVSERRSGKPEPKPDTGGGWLFGE